MSGSRRLQISVGKKFMALLGELQERLDGAPQAEVVRRSLQFSESRGGIDKDVYDPGPHGERLQFLLPPKTLARLDRLKGQISKSEAVRRSVSSFATFWHNGPTPY